MGATLTYLSLSRYTLNRRVHDVKTYPILSPQGATVLIYGHENGLTLVWRGGRRLKPVKREEGKRNGTAKAEVINLLDSDEETAPATASTFVDKPEFEDRSTDDEGAHPEIVQTLDLALGSAVLHVAVLPIAPCEASDASPDILQQKMVFAISCATTDTYVITLPLTPPSHESKQRPDLSANLLAGNAGNGKWGEKMIQLGGQGRTTDGLAMTLVKRRAASTERSRSPARSRVANAPAATRVIVAAHSKEASGTLQLWDVDVGAKPAAGGRPLEPFQTEYLPGPLSGVAFNPKHSTQLLAIDAPRGVRIYDYSIASVPSDDISDGPFPSQGSWLLTLYAPFARGSSSSTARKPIVAAAWIAHGQAILTLLADGQWGIWDIDGAGPSINGTSTSLFGKAGAGLRGAALTSFSVTGQVEGTSPLRNPAARRSEGDFVPMTPHSRRDVLASSLSGGPERLASVRGGIEVVQLPTVRSGPSDETAVLWLGGADHVVAVIPGVSRFWDAQVRKSAGGGVNLFSGAQPSRMVRITDLNAGLMGERCCGISAVVRFPQRFPAEPGEELPVEILIKGESRLVFVRESDDPSATAASFLSARSRKRQLALHAPASEPATAIIVHPRPDKPAAVSFNLSVSKRGSLRDPPKPPILGGGIGSNQSQDTLYPGTATNSFASSRYGDLLLGGGDGGGESQETAAFSFPGDEITMTQSMMMVPERGLGFANDLDEAANATDDEDAAEERNVEEEMLDIMEIDRALEEMEEDRDTGAQHVFFETG